MKTTPDVDEWVARARASLPTLASEGYEVRVGVPVDEPRYLRCGWEVPTEELGRRWLPWIEGPSTSPFFAYVRRVVDRRALDEGGLGPSVASVAFVFDSPPGLGARPVPAGVIPAPGVALVVPSAPSLLDAVSLAGVLNSGAFRRLWDAEPEGAGGPLARLRRVPVPLRESLNGPSLSRLVLRCIMLGAMRRELSDSERQELKRYESFLEVGSLHAYVPGYEEAVESTTSAEAEFVESTPPTSVEAAPVDAGERVTWALGLAFGRLPAEERPLGYGGELPLFDPTRTSAHPDAPAFLVDDAASALDVIAHLQPHQLALHASRLTLDELRRWIADDLFDHHLATHTHAGRAAPIYWKLESSTGRAVVWAHAPAFGHDAIRALLDDYLSPRIEHLERRLGPDSLEHDVVVVADAAEARRVRAELRELAKFRDALQQILPLWHPDPDDGVLVNHSLLRRFVRHTRWRRELDATWNHLAAGHFDWAHLAMRLWPERVVPKCADDRSLAVAHGLEDVFWFEDDEGKWRKRPEPTRPVAELVAERTSPTVKAALQALLDAPTHVGAKGKTKRRAREKS